MGSTESKTNYHFNPFTYELLPQTSEIKMEICMAIAINFTNSLLLATSANDIKSIQIKQGQLFNIQNLKKHSDHVTTLNFFKIKHQFISGSADNSIIVWSTNLLSNPKYLTKLKNHSFQITCLVISQNSEQVFISGSKDKQIKFWHQNIQTISFFDWTCWQTITEHTDQIYGLSINQDGNKLISCGRDGLILIMQKDDNQFWQIQQKIYKAIGFRLSFINNQMFAFQPLILHNHKLKASQNLLVYSWNSNSRCYVKSKQISIKGEGQWCHIYFPQTYIQSKEILMAKNGQTVNLIRFSNSETLQDCNYKLEQVIDYSNEIHKVIYQGRIFGTISHDGEYLILWDRNSSQIQIRQFKEQL